MTKRRRPGRLPRWQERIVYVSFGLLIATGIAWLLLEHFVRVAGEFGPEPHPAEHWALIAHGLVAYAFLIVAGTMVPVHITAGWNTQRNLKSGLAFAGMLVLLAVTALGLYYLGNESLRPQVSRIHWVAGVIALPLLLVHALKGRGNR
jgi:hypothetical protein